MDKSICDRWVAEKTSWKDMAEYVLFLKQKKAYLFAADYCAGKRVLDHGCGSGYGSNLLSQQADHVIGVDINAEVIDFCLRSYQAPNLTFQTIKADTPLPFVDGQFDVIVSFHVIEHIAEVKAYLIELRRVLGDNGILFISTPNRIYRLLPFQRPWNPEHKREYDRASLQNELRAIFSTVEILGVYGSDEVNAIEHRRVRQNPLRVYLYNPGVRVLKAMLPAIALSAIRRVLRRMSWPSEQARASVIHSIGRTYGVDDFTVGNDLRRALDLLAICHK
jgi:2-polyprenyl-3-methyl-5-hydroxy-6-metoxy-1,4-benzoquinol methylase